MYVSVYMCMCECECVCVCVCVCGHKLSKIVSPIFDTISSSSAAYQLE